VPDLKLSVEEQDVNNPQVGYHSRNPSHKLNLNIETNHIELVPLR
jgi:hypothetical protein